MKIYHNKLTSMTKLIELAEDRKYAVGHFNINNLEWTKAILMIAEETKTPVILGVSEGAAHYMGDLKSVVLMVNGLLDALNITIPVVLHLDHGQTPEVAITAIDAGFSSVMFDGSRFPFRENMQKLIKVLAYAKKYEVSVEAEIGTIGGEEDGVIGSGELGDPQQAAMIAKTGITVLAAGFNNIHGVYPENWKGLNFNVLENIHQTANIPLVLHGGSGIPDNQITESIQKGISKINVNTECQMAACEGLKTYFFTKEYEKLDKGYDPRKIWKNAITEIKNVFIKKTKLFGCYGQAK